MLNETKERSYNTSNTCKSNTANNNTMTTNKTQNTVQLVGNGSVFKPTPKKVVGQHIPRSDVTAQEKGSQPAEIPVESVSGYRSGVRWARPNGELTKYYYPPYVEPR